WPYLVPPFLAGAAIIVLSMRAKNHEQPSPQDARNPLRLGEALRLAAIFQLAIIVVDFVSRHWGTGGVMASSVALGVSDVDALTVAMTRLSGTAGIGLAAEGIGVGILTNTVVKAGIALVVGRGAFRRRAVLGLTILALSSAFGLWLGRTWLTP
ncbi:MAG TPA: DUF4010 domain-containing protein, partial [Gemmatimonadaceae bacterium]